jgi:hypothetical protein
MTRCGAEAAPDKRNRPGKSMAPVVAPTADSDAVRRWVGPRLTLFRDGWERGAAFDGYGVRAT